MKADAKLLYKTNIIIVFGGSKYCRLTLCQALALQECSWPSFQNMDRGKNYIKD